MLTWPEKLRRVAEPLGFVPVREEDLEKGDKFCLFVGLDVEGDRYGIEEEVVWTWLGAEGGFGRAEFNGRSGMFTGEDWVAVKNGASVLGRLKETLRRGGSHA